LDRSRAEIAREDAGAPPGVADLNNTLWVTTLTNPFARHSIKNNPVFQIIAVFISVRGPQLPVRLNNQFGERRS
jgi:hypothetical protein